MTTAEKQVLAKAIQWWNASRPLGWTREQHLDQPSGCQIYGSANAHLSVAVSKLVKEKMKKRKGK